MKEKRRAGIRKRRRKGCFPKKRSFDVKSYEKQTLSNIVKSSNRCDDVKVTSASGKYSFFFKKENQRRTFPLFRELETWLSPLHLSLIAILEKPGADRNPSGKEVIIRQAPSSVLTLDPFFWQEIGLFDME